MQPGAEILPEIKQPGKKLVIKPKKFPAGRPEEHSGSTRTTTHQNKSDAADRISGHQLTRDKRESAQLPRLAHIALQTEDLSEEKEDNEDTKAETSASRHYKIHFFNKATITCWLCKGQCHEKLYLQLRPWGDGLDPNHPPHMVFIF